MNAWSDVVAEHIRRQSFANAERVEQLLVAMFREGGGCRGIAPDPPGPCGRAIYFKHEFPYRSLRRLLGLKVPCYCGDMLG